MTPALCATRRTALGWTLEELAHRARLSLSAVRTYELGLRPGAGVRRRIAETLEG